MTIKLHRIILAVILGLVSRTALARGQYFNYVNQGGHNVVTSSSVSRTKVQRSFSGATVKVCVTGSGCTSSGGTVVTLYSDSAGTPLGNPMTAASDGSFTFWTDSTSFDIAFYGPGITTVCGLSSQLPCISTFTWPNQVLSSSAPTFINVKSSGAFGNTVARTDGIAVSSNTAFTSASAVFSSGDTGKTIFVQGAGAAGGDLVTTVTFVNTTTLTLAAAPSTSVNPSTYYLGNLDDTGINTALTAAIIGAGFQAYKGAYTGSVPDVYFPQGIYLISTELVVTAGVVNIHSDANALIVQTSSSNRSFVFNNCYNVRVSGLRFQRGKYAVDCRNANADFSQLVFEDNEVQSTSSYAVFTAATVSSPATNIPYSTGTISVVAGTSTATGSGTTWSDANHAMYDLHLIASDQWYKVAEVTGVGTLILNSVALTTQTNVAYEIGDYHLSMNTIINRCRFFNVNKVLFNNADRAWVGGPSWITVIGQTSRADRNFTTNSAAFRNYNGWLILDQMFGVPLMGTFGVDRPAAVRWIDQDAGTVQATHCRFGGESGGMSPLWFTAPYYDVASQQRFSAYQTGGRVIIENSIVYAGQFANKPDSGVLVLRPNGRAATARENVPQQFVYKHNEGHTASPIINNNALLDTSTFFTGIANSELKFRYDIGPNDTGTDTIGLQGTWNGATASIGFVKYTGSFTYSGSLTFGTVNAGACTTQTISASGVVDGDSLSLGLPAAVATASDLLSWKVWVSTSDTGGNNGVVSIRACNGTAATNVATGGANTFKVHVRKASWYTD